MSFNRQKQYKVFREDVKRIEEAFREDDFSEEKISGARIAVEEFHHSDMKHYAHNQSLSCTDDDFDDENNSLLKNHFDKFAVNEDYITDVFEQIDSVEVYMKLKSMSETNQRIVRLLIDKYTLADISELLNIGYWGVVKRVQQIRRELFPIMKKLFPEVFESDNNDTDIAQNCDEENRTFAGGGENE